MKSFFRQGPSQREDIERTIQKHATDEQRKALLSDIAKTQCALEIAYAGFDNATDPDLIDCYIFEVNSALKRYRFLLNQAADAAWLKETSSSTCHACDPPEALSQWGD